MTIMRATVVLTTIEVAPEDHARNVWHFSLDGLITDAHMTKVGNFLNAFYNGVNAFLSPALSKVANANRIEMAEVTPGQQGVGDDAVSTLKATRLWTLAATGATALPAEVAVALSFRGDIAGVAEEEQGGFVRPKSRRRGRIYLGPLATAASNQVPVSLKSMVNPAMMQAMVDQYIAAENAHLIGVGDPQHIVYSPTGAEVHVVKRVHVDNAFDTIRSRGHKSTARVVLDV